MKRIFFVMITLFSSLIGASKDDNVLFGCLDMGSDPVYGYVRPPRDASEYFRLACMFAGLITATGLHSSLEDVYAKNIMSGLAIVGTSLITSYFEHEYFDIEPEALRAIVMPALFLLLINNTKYLKIFHGVLYV